MKTQLTIDTDWLSSDGIDANLDLLCFSELGIRFGNVWLTEAVANEINSIRHKNNLSAYRLAEWLAWNWWRLRWEPRKSNRDWCLAHSLPTIGGGFIWPNITIYSDGYRVALIAKPTKEIAQEPVRYISDSSVFMSSELFEDGIDRFFKDVKNRLVKNEINESNFEMILYDLMNERNDPKEYEKRKFEAMLGLDPDESDQIILDQFIKDSQIFGSDSMQEIAAHKLPQDKVLNSSILKTQAHELGTENSLDDAVLLDKLDELKPLGQDPAWKRGAEAAQLLRDQERLGSDPLSDELLAEMMGVMPSIIKDNDRRSDLSFELDPESNKYGRIVLRSLWETGRRFDLARLLGDRLVGGCTKGLYPATRSYTYRQKVQRSFAAELLCPIRTLVDMLKEDYSEEAIEESAGYFNVSPMMVTTLLVNHRYIDRDDLEELRDNEVVSAA